MAIFIIPKPLHLEQTRGSFTLNAQTAIIFDKASQTQAGQLKASLLPATGYSFDGNGNTIELNLKGSKNLGSEGYTLNVTSDKIILSAYACQYL